MPSIRIETERLILQPRSIAEMESLCANEPSPELKQAYGEMLATMRAVPAQAHWGSNWRISQNDGTVVGGLCFKGAPDANGLVELGYGIDEPYRRRGYATEAVAAILCWALAQAAVRAVLAETEDDNIASQNTLLHNGFRPAGRGAEGLLFRIDNP